MIEPSVTVAIQAQNVFDLTKRLPPQSRMSRTRRRALKDQSIPLEFLGIDDQRLVRLIK